MAKLPCGSGLLDDNGSDSASGAQTERRGGAGPVMGLLGGKDLAGRSLQPRISGQESDKHGLKNRSAIDSLRVTCSVV
jgi:hypothetical protein